MFRKKYHYIQKCPRCNSFKTGRYIYILSNTFQKEKMIARAMINGELIRPICGFGNTNDVNAYCEDCGAEWYEKETILYLDKKQIKKERERRGITSENISSMINFKKIKKRQDKKQKKDVDNKKDI